jgi:hypothetical protein
VQALGGAKNHMLVLPDADLDLAADMAVNAGYGAAGERCMAISVVLAVEPVADALIEKVAERIAKLRSATAQDRRARHGPADHRVHRDKVSSYVDIAERTARVVVDGRGFTSTAPRTASSSAPRCDQVPTTSAAYQEEIFGPVLSVVRVELRRGRRTHQLGSVRQRHRDLHQRRRRGAALPERGRGRHDRHQRADPCAGRVPLVRRLEAVAVRRREGVRRARVRLLHAREGGHQPLARPGQARGINLGFPQNN